ncbi:carboxylesterase 4A [Dugong dugon]
MVERGVASGACLRAGTGDNQARGNWALLDQLAALFWVQEKNIEVFGRDWDCMTLFGQSAGSMCISGLMVSPLAQGLFYQAISQNSIMVFRVFITPGPLRVAKVGASPRRGLSKEGQAEGRPEHLFFSPEKVAHLAGYSHNSMQILVNCLRGFLHLNFQQDAGEIMKIPLSQCIRRKDTITRLLWSTSTLLNITKEQTPLVVEEYMSDAGLPVYLDEFEYHSSGGIIIKPHTDGADHGDEIHFLFGSSFSKGPSTDEEMAGSLQMMRYFWAVFLPSARHHQWPAAPDICPDMCHRNPNGGNLSYWPSCEKDEKYLQLDVTMSVGVKLTEKMDFWMRLHQH